MVINGEIRNTFAHVSCGETKVENNTKASTDVTRGMIGIESCSLAFVDGNYSYSVLQNKHFLKELKVLVHLKQALP